MTTDQYNECLRQANLAIKRLQNKIAELEKERDALEESRKNLIWFTRDEIKGLDPEQAGFIDLRAMKLEQQAKGVEDFVSSIEGFSEGYIQALKDGE